MKKLSLTGFIKRLIFSMILTWVSLPGEMHGPSILVVCTQIICVLGFLILAYLLAEIANFCFAFHKRRKIKVKRNRFVILENDEIEDSLNIGEEYDFLTR